MSTKNFHNDIVEKDAELVVLSSYEADTKQDMEKKSTYSSGDEAEDEGKIVKNAEDVATMVSFSPHLKISVGSTTTPCFFFL